LCFFLFKRRVQVGVYFPFEIICADYHGPPKCGKAIVAKQVFFNNNFLLVVIKEKINVLKNIKRLQYLFKGLQHCVGNQQLISLFMVVFLLN